MSAKAGIAKLNINLITGKWLELEKLPNVFAYSLNVRKQRYLPGNFQFYAEYNPERTSLRRPPQRITSLDPIYSDEQFNFNKVDPKEHIATFPYDDDIEVCFIINKSPLTKYHTLICPERQRGRYGQRVTLQSLRFCAAFLRDLNDKAFRIGYNSPGALASVNHLHFHLMYIDVDLYIDHQKLELLSKEYIYRLSKDMPTQAICWCIYKTDNVKDFNMKLTEIYEFLMWLCAQNRPHNIFMTPTRNDDHEDAIKIFIFAREKHCVIKDVKSFNIGFCELAGYVPVGNEDVYDKLTEELVLSKICDETGCVYKEAYSYFEK